MIFPLFQSMPKRRENNEESMQQGPDPSGGITLEEQSLRDGLQNEARLFSLHEKLEIVRLLEEAGITRLQIGSFVDPRRVPQMRDTEELAERVHANWPHLACSALVLNAQGLDRAIRCGMRHLSLSFSLSDTHSRRNAGCSTEEALDGMIVLVRKAAGLGIRVRAGIQCAFGCADHGQVAFECVADAALRLTMAGAVEINLADTAGMAHPIQVRQVVAKVRAAAPATGLSLHLHDARGLGLANMFAGFEAGVRLFDVCVGGLGGCPFIKGAAGNVAAEDAVNLFERMGEKTGIDLQRLVNAALHYETLLGRELPGKMSRVLHPVCT
jgi:hydroxymethylglutaryl-CoA lyase